MTDALIRVVVQGDEAVAGVGRIEQAFGRLERNQPTMALRTTRRAIDELAVAATGLHPVMGRVLATFAEMGIGGAVGLGAVAGFAAIGLEIKTILEFADKLDKKLIQLNTTIARGPTSLAFKAQAFGQQADELQNPGVWQTIKNTAMDMLTDKGAAVGRAAELATAQTGAALAQRDYEKAQFDEQRRGLRETSKALADSAFAIDRLKAGLHPTNVQLAALDSASRLTAIALSGANEETKKRLQLLELERAGLEHVNAATKDRQARDDQRRKDEAAFPTVGVVGDVYYRARLGRGGNVSSSTDMGTPFENTIRGASAMAAGTWNPGPPSKAADNKIDSARLAAEAVALLGALKQGGAAGIFGAAGGIASDLGGLKGLGGFTPIGIGLNVVSGLFGMFDHSAERRHREEMEKLTRLIQNTDKRGQPDHTSITIMLNGKEVSGALVDDVIYQINRMSRRDATPRLPSR